MTAPDKPYVIIAHWGTCHLCGKHDDIRYGACFACADFVDGERLSATTHRLWDKRNPSNEWVVSETGDA